MEVASRQVRPFRQIEDDGLYPKAFPRPDEHLCDRRCRAIAEVLERFPEEPYQRLKKIKNSKRRSFDWFVPKLNVLGLAYPFIPNVRPRPGSFRRERFGESILTPYARIIYLSPLLEYLGRDNLVYVVAHELAHVFLNHALHFTEAEGMKAEREVSHRVRLWGFGREARQTEGHYPAPEIGMIDAESVRLPEAARRFIQMARAIGLDIRSVYPDGEELCVEVFSAGDLELLSKIAGQGYHETIEQYNDGNAESPSPRILLVVFVPVVDLPKLIEKLAGLTVRAT